MRVLVAGGAGMIGSNIVRLLGPSAVVADVSVDGWDLRNFSVCQMAVEGMDAIYDCAARTVGIEYSSNHHGEMFYDTAAISLNLLEAARLANVKKYMVVSSSCVYPDWAQVPVLESDGEPGAPESANLGYGWAKRFAEIQGRLYAEQYGMHVVIVRPGNVYGPSYNWANPEMHVIPSLISKMLGGDDPLTVWGSGQQTRSFLYEEDCARLMIALMEKGTRGEAYNLGGEEVSIGKLTKLLAELCEYTGTIIFDAGKPEGPARKAQNTKKLEMLLGKALLTPLREGLQKTIEHCCPVKSRRESVS
ncbi:MAG: NAD-dependent epimerase/dehydratase family protein [Terriglobales bacterium]